MATIEDIDPVLAEYGLAATGQPIPIGAGTLNWNWRVETAAGPRFLRRHRPDNPRDRIEAEHALLAWVSDRNIPVAQPFVARSGTCIVEHQNALWALFPWIAGNPPTRGSLTPRQAYAAGEMHGRIARALAVHPGQGAVPAPLTYDTPSSVASLQRLVAAAERQQAGTWILDGLRLQLTLLRRHGHEGQRLEGLTTGLSHGDYHDQQLLFDGGHVVAVTDWEMFGVRSLVYEVIRSLWFSQLMEQPVMDDYMTGYRQHVRLAEPECRLGMELWWQGRLHTTWVYEALYTEGNTRVAGLLPETVRALRVLADDATREALAKRFVQSATG